MSKRDNIQILEDVFCKTCGWNVIDVLTNGDFFEKHPVFQYYDYVWYCSNPLCPNHKGEGLDLNADPVWTVQHE